MNRPPANFFTPESVTHLVETLEALDHDPSCRVTVLAATGKSFCAGEEFGGKPKTPTEFIEGGRVMYALAARMFEVRKPIIAAVQGAAVGGGVGPALACDFRVTCESATWSTNFTRLGLHSGFGISTILPRIVGQQNAAKMLLFGQRLKGDEVFKMGLADKLTATPDAVLPAAVAMAIELATFSAPLAVQDTRTTLRRGLADAVRVNADRELLCQAALMATADVAEGIKAYSERREPKFEGK
jgi:2-(1,2-epoxy-1,2-dihydrophenyl)acetyl-CoA isomerase